MKDPNISARGRVRVHKGWECNVQDEKVLERARSGARHRRGGPLPLALVVALAIAGVAATSGAAYALSDAAAFFQAMWGNHGMGDNVDWTQDTGTETLSYTRNYRTVDPAALSEDMSAAVEDVELSVQANGYTLTVESMVVDEVGCGAVSFMLSNLAGVALSDGVSPTGELVLEQVAGGVSLGMESADAAQRYADLEAGGVNGDAPVPFMDTRCIVDQEASTETELRGTMYFSSWGNLDLLRNGVVWTLRSGDGESGERASTSVFTPSKAVGTCAFSDGSGVRVQLSPFSFTVAYPKGDDEFSAERLTVRYQDGTEFVIEDDQGASMVANAYFSCGNDDGTVSYLPTQLIDVGKVATVSVDGCWPAGAGGREKNVPQTFTLGPEE